MLRATDLLSCIVIVENGIRVLLIPFDNTIVINNNSGQYPKTMTVHIVFVLNVKLIIECYSQFTLIRVIQHIIVY